jgi:hypothetical protein
VSYRNLFGKAEPPNLDPGDYRRSIPFHNTVATSQADIDTQQNILKTKEARLYSLKRE